MSPHRTLIRLFLIIGFVKRPGFPSLSDIQAMLEENDFSVSFRTLQRDLEKIRIDLGIDIVYNKYHRGYFLDREFSQDLDPLLNFMELTIVSGNLLEYNKNSDGIKNYISFESEGRVKGLEFIPKILYALKNKRTVTITYQRFSDETEYEIKVKPGLLKEYQDRWYLISYFGPEKEFRAYALDRIKSLRVNEEYFPAIEIESIQERFLHVIGISLSSQKPHIVEITINKDQWKYIESLPWHPSQEKTREDKRSVTFQLFVVHNYELEQKILSEGNNIIDIKPDWLEKKIQERTRCTSGSDGGPK